MEKRNYNKKEGQQVIHEFKRKNGYTQKVVYIKKKYFSDEMKKNLWIDYKNKMKKKDLCEKYNISHPTLNKYLKMCEDLQCIKELENNLQNINITTNLNEDDKKEDNEFNKIELTL